MKLSILTLAFAFLATLPSLSNAMDKHAMKDKMMMETPAVKAVAFHSDNCGSCKILAPKMAAALEAINKDKLDIVQLDYTNAETKAASMSLATKKSLTNVMEQYGPKTGFVLLLDGQGQVVDKITKESTAGEIAAKIAKAIGDAATS